MTDSDDTYFERLMRLLKRPGARLRRFDTDVREDLYGARHGFAYVRHLARGNKIKRRA